MRRVQISDLIAQAVDRSEEAGIRRVKCRLFEEWHRDTDRQKSTPRLWLGQQSAFVPEGRAGTKYIDRAVWPVSFGEVSRQWMRYYASERGEKITVRPSRHTHEIFSAIPPAGYFLPPKDRHGPWTLVDIKACYFSLWQPMTFDLDINPITKRFGIGRHDARPAVDLSEDKEVRNALWGNLSRRKIPELRFGEWAPEDKCAPNSRYCAGLGIFVYLACHSIMSEAREKFGFISWSTDGGITRPDDARKFVSWLWESWGLTAEIRAEGPGYVWGRNSWSIGGAETADIPKGRAIKQRALQPPINVQTSTRDWLRSIRLQRINENPDKIYMPRKPGDRLLSGTLSDTDIK